MVIERVRDNEHSIIDVIHIVLKETIDSIDIPEDEFHNMAIEEVRKELLEDFPDYTLVYAAKMKDYEKQGSVGLIMRYVARGVKYFNQM